MTVRDYTDADREHISAIHAEQGLDYQMLDLNSPLVFAKSVCVENGQIIGATFLKVEAETYLVMKSDVAPALKWDAIRLMQLDIVKQAIKYGITQLVAYIPDCIRFNKRLSMLGWKKQRDGWTPWSYEVKPCAQR
jgi:hypothetical protein